jgi:hypothetical protein
MNAARQTSRLYHAGDDESEDGRKISCSKVTGPGPQEHSMQDENSDDGDDDDVDFHDDFNFQDQEKVQMVLSRLKENSDHRSFLKWRDDARPQARPPVYTGDSDRTHRRKKEAARAHAATFEDYPRITAFFTPALNELVEPTGAEETSESESNRPIRRASQKKLIERKPVFQGWKIGHS